MNAVRTVMSLCSGACKRHNAAYICLGPVLPAAGAARVALEETNRPRATGQIFRRMRSRATYALRMGLHRTSISAWCVKLYSCMFITVRNKPGTQYNRNQPAVS